MSTPPSDCNGHQAKKKSIKLALMLVNDCSSFSTLPEFVDSLLQGESGDLAAMLRQLFIARHAPRVYDVNERVL